MSDEPSTPIRLAPVRVATMTAKADLLARLVAASDAARSRYHRHAAWFLAAKPDWAGPGSMISGRIEVTLVVEDPQRMGERPMVVSEDGVPRSVVTRLVSRLEDANGWVHRDELGARSNTADGRRALHALRALEARGLIERADRWVRPTDAGRGIVRAASG